MLETSFSKTEFDSTLDQTLGSFVPENVITRMKTWMDGRRAYVQSVIDPYLATHPVAPVPIISGEPRSPTPLTSATLKVVGAGVTQFRYSLNGGPFGPTNSVASPIVLTGLPNGSANSVSVIAAGSDGVWQPESEAAISKTWTVNTSIPTVRINEVLAKNDSAYSHSGDYPDLIELYNEGASPVDLSGLRLSDKVTSPNKFSFPNGTTLGAGAYLLLFADSAGSSGLHTGFSLKQDGEGVFLFDKTANGGALLDSVEFGLQLPDLAIGRIGTAGEFVLTQPTPGTANAAQPVADPRQLKINEWLASEVSAANTDFIELYNPASLPAALGGLYFTENPIGDPTKHKIAPLTFIAPKGYRLFKADNDPEQGVDHLNFKLAAEEGLIALLAPDLEIIDTVLYGPQRTDVSQGRSPDGSSNIAFFSTPTGGSANPLPAACTVTGTNFIAISLTNVWKYYQTASLDGVNWTQPNYNDNAWPQGEGLLAFENNSAITPLVHTSLSDPRSPPAGLTAGHAYYFRTRVVLPNDATNFTFTAQAYIDDGAVLYVNGSEVTPRIRMDPGVVLNGTFASSLPPTGDAVDPDTFIIPGQFFAAGTNIIAVEVHQRNDTSSDIVWGMELEASQYTTNCEQSTVVLNEVLASNHSFPNSAGATPDWAELFNGSTNAVDLSDMSLSDETSAPRKWVFPDGASIAPGEHLVIEFDDTQPASAANTGFTLNAGGGALYLFARLAEGGSVSDSIRIGMQARDFSIGRIPDGSGNWALTLPSRETANVGASLGNASALKINEWMANPIDGNDWLELYNPNTQPVEISGLTLTDDVSQRDKSPLQPLSFIGPEGFQMLIADGTQGKADHANFKLAAAAGFIGLYWPIGTQIDSVSYGSQLSDVSEGRFTDGAANIVAFPESSSPGAPNYLPLTNLVINEVLSHTDPPLEDAIEIQNVSSNTVDISGWYLSNEGQSLRKYRVPPNTLVGSGGFRVFYEYQFGTNASTNALEPFTFNSAHGDEAYLSQTDAGGDFTGYRAHVKFGAAQNGVSFGRFLTSVGEEFVSMEHRSFGEDDPFDLEQFRTGAGAANPNPLVGPVVINEIQYHPANSYSGDTSAGEFIELLNITATNVPLLRSECHDEPMALGRRS